MSAARPEAVARAFDHAELGPLLRATRPTVMTVLSATLLHLVRGPDTTPEEVIFLEKMPLNPTGKVDRAALKKMAAGDHAHHV
jgi:acyl-coenzyme A synthetase/AMP-(fatty) acid ligase